MHSWRTLKTDGKHIHHWSFDVPVNKSLKSSQMYPDSPVSLKKSKSKEIEDQQFLVKNVPVNRSLSHIEGSFQERKDFYVALRQSFDVRLKQPIEVPTQLVVSRSISTRSPIKPLVPHINDKPTARYADVVKSRSSIRKVRGYRPYSIGEYKNLALSRAGGLGPDNLRSEDWERRKSKLDRMKLYNSKLKLAKL